MKLNRPFINIQAGQDIMEFLRENQAFRSTTSFPWIHDFDNLEDAFQEESSSFQVKIGQDVSRLPCSLPCIVSLSSVPSVAEQRASNILGACHHFRWPELPLSKTFTFPLGDITQDDSSWLRLFLKHFPALKSIILGLSSTGTLCRRIESVRQSRLRASCVTKWVAQASQSHQDPPSERA